MIRAYSVCNIFADLVIELEVSRLPELRINNVLGHGRLL